MIVSIMAGFAFGYCIVDMFRNYQAEKRINEMISEVIKEKDYYES